MTPLRAKIYVRLFAALSLSVLANLLLFQPRLPARGSALASVQPHRAEALPVGGNKVEAKPTRSAVASTKLDLAEQTIRSIQRELKDIGHYPGEIDGRSNQLLHAAIFAYQQQYGLTITAEPSEPLLVLLQARLDDPGSVSTGASTATAGAGVAPGSAADKLVADVRQLLASVGYKSERSDGRLTADLIRAIRKYESDHAMLPTTGRISAALIAQLQRKGGPASRARTG